jgi:hypothetical protein
MSTNSSTTLLQQDNRNGLNLKSSTNKNSSYQKSVRFEEPTIAYTREVAANVNYAESSEDDSDDGYRAQRKKKKNKNSKLKSSKASDKINNNKKRRVTQSDEEDDDDERMSAPSSKINKKKQNELSNSRENRAQMSSAINNVITFLLSHLIISL